MGMPTIRTGASQGRSVNDNMLRADRYRSLVAHSTAAKCRKIYINPSILTVAAYGRSSPGPVGATN